MNFENWNKFEGEREDQLRERLASLKKRSAAGEWMQESPSDLDCTIGEIDRLRAEIRELYIKALNTENPLAPDIITILGDLSEESLKAMRGKP